MTNKGSRTNPYTPGEYSGMRKKVNGLEVGYFQHPIVVQNL